MDRPSNGCDIFLPGNLPNASTIKMTNSSPLARVRLSNTNRWTHRNCRRLRSCQDVAFSGELRNLNHRSNGHSAPRVRDGITRARRRVVRSQGRVTRRRHRRGQTRRRERRLTRCLRGDNRGNCVNVEFCRQGRRQSGCHHRGIQRRHMDHRTKYAPPWLTNSSDYYHDHQTSRTSRHALRGLLMDAVRICRCRRNDCGQDQGGLRRRRPSVPREERWLIQLRFTRDRR